jgi:segregation and condensation protein B
MLEAEVRNIVEAALLAAGKSLTISELAQLFDDSDRPAASRIREAIEALQVQFQSRPVEIKETGAGFRVQVRREYASAVARLWPERPQRYSRALLETLSLIAYRQPITRAEIEAVRGVTVNPNITKTLLERQWVRVVGHRDLPGRPELLGTTREFLEYFGLRSLDELPPLSELRTLEGLDPQLEFSDVPPQHAIATQVAATADEQGDEESAEADGADGDSDSDETTPERNASGLVAAPPRDGD